MVHDSQFVVNKLNVIWEIKVIGAGEPKIIVESMLGLCFVTNQYLGLTHCYKFLPKNRDS